MQFGVPLYFLKGKLASSLVGPVRNTVLNRSLCRLINFPPFTALRTVRTGSTSMADCSAGATRIAVAQMTSTDRMDDNFTTCSRLAEVGMIYV